MAYSYVWPLTLPQRPLASGYSETPGNNILRSPMDAGPAKLRLRGRRPDSMNVTYVVTLEQIETFETFVSETIRGTARFGWLHPRKLTTVEARLVPDSEGGLYRLVPVSGEHWHLSMMVEVLP